MRKLLLLTFAVIIGFTSTFVFSSPGGSAAKNFPDVNTQYSKEVQFLVENNVVTGYPDGTFRPNEEVTRGQAAAFIARALKLEGEKRKTPFPDVSKDYQFSGYIDSASKQGIITGYPDGSFRPDVKVSRAEMAIMLTRAFTIEPTSDVSITFTDVRMGAEANKAIQLIADARISTGYPDRTFRPNNHLTRIEFALFVARTMSVEFRLNLPLLGKVITVDPGHGGHDGGAAANGIIEKILALEVGLLLRDELRAAGATVVMTRTTDVYLTLSERAQIANNAEADAFISIHANSFTKESAHGLETFWHSKYEAAESKQLAETIQKHLVQTLKLHNRGAKEGNFHVVRETKMPSVLVELGFISNPTEAELMKTQAFKEDSARAILAGVLEFYSR